LSIRVHYDNVNFRLKRSGEVKRFLGKVIGEEERILGDLVFIFTGDEEMILINRKFLSHDYYTDVISFDYGEGKNVSGEIYISCETVKRNGRLYNVSYKEEIIRVMIHGILHLCGYGDDREERKKKMMDRQEELLEKFIGGKW